MGVKDPAGRIVKMLKKYRYPALILLVGICLMILPTQKEEKVSTVTEATAQERLLEERLEEILSGMEGVGQVDVLLSLSKGESIVYQTDEDTRRSDSDQTDQITTVTVSQSDRTEIGLVRQIDPPEYLGAVIACQGASNANVRFAVVEAVSKATGLGADRIAVVKMK